MIGDGFIICRRTAGWPLASRCFHNASEDHNDAVGLGYGVKAVNWLNPLLGIAGLGVSVWAFWLSRKLGYLLVAICFLLTLGGQFVLPAINRAIATRWPAQPEIAPEIEQQYMQELVSLNEKYYPTGRTGTLTLKLPLDQIVLVFGLWLLAKHESKRIAKQ